MASDQEIIERTITEDFAEQVLGHLGSAEKGVQGAAICKLVHLCVTQSAMLVEEEIEEDEYTEYAVALVDIILQSVREDIGVSDVLH